MALKGYDEDDIKNIANAIREKTGSEESLKVENMASAIENIPSSAVRLPDEYQEVEYISSSGENQYIITDVIPNQDTRIELKMLNQDTKVQFIYGAREGASTKSFAIGYISSKYRIDYNSQMISTVAAKTSAEVVYQDKNNLYIDNVLVGSATYAEFSPTRATGGIYLFNINTNGTIGTSDASRFAKMTLYYCKIWQGKTLVRNFVPCYKKDDSKIGLYDLVGKKFYENKGATAFEKGKDVGGSEKFKPTFISYAYSPIDVQEDIYKIDTSNVTNMKYMFRSYEGTNDLDLTSLDYSNVTTFSEMFAYSSKSISINMSNKSFPKLTNMLGMFDNSKIKSVDFTGIETPSLETIGSMFTQCTNLVSVDLTSLNTSKVYSCSYMFQGCTNIEHIDFGDNFILPGIKTGGSMRYMFSSTTKLDDDTLNQILKVFASATNVPSSYKSLSYNSFPYSKTRLQTLPNWQMFVDAGWS